MDLSTTYLGLKLKNPWWFRPRPLCEEIGNIRRMEDAGAGAVVLHSLFEEQIDDRKHAARPRLWRRDRELRRSRCVTSPT